MLETLGLVVFELAESDLKLVSPQQAWFERIFGGAEDLESLCERSDFLEHFLSGAREFWEADRGREVLRSGRWEEQGEYFEARALSAGSSRLLIIKRGGAEFEELSEVVQRSNELALERSKLNRETQRRVVLLDCLVHDLSNPLASVLVNLQMLAKRLPGGLERDAARMALGQVERQRGMLRSVVGLFSADLGLDTEGECVADAGEVVVEAVRTQLASAMDCGVALGAESPDGPLPVVAETGHLLRAVENLIINAIRHSPQNGGVTVGLVPGEDDVLIRVDDEGAGVPPEVAGSLFEPFERGAGGGQAGLGLFFCKRVVDRWGGRIGFEPRDPNGARFWMRLRRTGV